MDVNAMIGRQVIFTDAKLGALSGEIQGVFKNGKFYIKAVIPSKKGPGWVRTITRIVYPADCMAIEVPIQGSRT